MKRGIIIFSSVLVLLIGALLIGPSFVDWSHYKVQGQSQIKSLTGLDADLNGDISLALLPFPHVLIEDVKIKAPKGSAQDYLVSLERLDVSVALVPLLSGEVVVQSVQLVKPAIALEVFQNGEQNWMTPEIAALLSKGEGTQSGGDVTKAISLESVSIEGGYFQFKSFGADQAFVVSDINLDITAKSLTGPFDVEGEITSAGNVISFDAKAGEIKPETSSFSLKANAKIAPAGLVVSYAGVVGFGEELGIQGETKLNIASLASTLAAYGVEGVALGQDSLALKGFLTASPERLDYKDLTFSVAGNDLTGSLGVDLPSLNVSGSFRAADILNVDAFLGSGSKKAVGGSGLDILLTLVPESLSMPASFEAAIELALPGLVYNKNAYSDVAFGLAKQGAHFKAAFSALDIPGKGRLEASADLHFKSKSVSEKTGGVTYSDGVLSVGVTGKTQNMPYTVQALSGLSDLPYISTVKAGHFDVNSVFTASSFALKDSVVKLDGTTFALSGSYRHTVKRPELQISVTADDINLDSFMAEGQKSDEKTDVTAGLKSLALPFDLDLELGAQTLNLDGQVIKGVKLHSVLGASSFTIRNASVQDYAGVRASLTGRIEDFRALSGIDLSFSGETQNIRTLAGIMKWDVSGLPASLKAAKLGAKLSGDIDNLGVRADVDALDGRFTANGQIENPLGAMEIDGLAVQVKHKNMARALQIFGISVPNYKSFSQPVDFSAKVQRTENVFTLSDIKAQLAGTSLAGALSYSTAGALPLLSGDLKFDDLKLVSSKGSYAPSRGGGSSKSSAPQRRWSRDALDIAWMRSFDADLNVVANSILYDVWDLKKPELSLGLHGGKLEIKKLQSGLFDGHVALTATLNAPASSKKPASFKVSPSFTNVSLEPLVKAMAGSAIIRGKGRISMNADLSAIGLSQAALVGGLRGQGVMTGSDIVLDGIDLTRFATALSGETKAGDSLLGLWKGVSKGGSTAFDTLDGAFDVSEGVVNITKLDLDGAQAFLKTSGNVNLAKWTLATAHTITLKDREDVPPFTINISGSLDNPGQTFAQGALTDYLSRKINRKLEKLLTDKLGLPSGQSSSQGNQGQQPSQQQPVTPEEAFRGLLEGLIR